MRGLMTFPPPCIFVPCTSDGSTSAPPWVPGFPASLEISYHPVEKQKPKAAGNSVYWLCVFPSEVVPLPDHKQGLCIFSFHSLWVILIEASAAVPVTSGRGTLGMFWFQAPYFSSERPSSPLHQYSAVNSLPQWHDALSLSCLHLPKRSLSYV